MSEEYGDIINRMMRQLDEDDASPKGAPRCDGCGRREPLQPYTRTKTDGGSETLYYCLECRTLSSVAEAEDRAS